MTRMTRIHAFALVLLSALSLSACTPLLAPQAKPAAAPPAPSPPIVDLDATVEAADALILDYWAAVNEAYQSDGVEVSSLTKAAIPLIADEEVAIAHLFAENGLTLIADYTARDTQFQGLFMEDGRLYLRVTTCVDYSGVHTVDSNGMEHPVTRPLPQTINDVYIEVGDPDDFTGLRIARWIDRADDPC